MEVSPVTLQSHPESTMTFSSKPPWVTHLSTTYQEMYSTNPDLSLRKVQPIEGLSKAKAIFCAMSEGKDKTSIYSQIEKLQTEEDFLERDENGQTLLHRLSASNYPYSMELLLDAAKNCSTECLEKCLLAVDNKNKTAFYRACQKGLETAVEILI